MDGIYDPNDSFDFSKLVLSKPTAMTGGNYFIRFSYLENPLYIQPPKSTTKQGILKAGKRHYCDLLFSNEHDSFTRWMENLETYCQEKIFQHRAQWFDGDMELHEIENYFAPPLKSFKSGKFYLVRVNISPVLGKVSLKIYDENEKEVALESIDDKTRVLSILEIQGIKCSAKSFQIEIELKQMMVLKSVNLFEKCLLRGGAALSKDLEETIQVVKEPFLLEESIVVQEEKEEKEKEPEEPLEIMMENKEDVAEVITYQIEDIPPKQNTDLEEIEFDLEELPKENPFQLKERKEVYYEIYKQAMKKAKLAREMAVSAYLEAKQIKNTYMIEELNDSDLEDDDFDFSKTQNE